MASEGNLKAILGMIENCGYQWHITYTKKGWVMLYSDGSHLRGGSKAHSTFASAANECLEKIIIPKEADE